MSTATIPEESLSATYTRRRAAAVARLKSCHEEHLLATKRGDAKAEDRLAAEGVRLVAEIKSFDDLLVEARHEEQADAVQARLTDFDRTHHMCRENLEDGLERALRIDALIDELVNEAKACRENLQAGTEPLIRLARPGRDRELGAHAQGHLLSNHIERRLRALGLLPSGILIGNEVRRPVAEFVGSWTKRFLDVAAQHRPADTNNNI